MSNAYVLSIQGVAGVSVQDSPIIDGCAVSLLVPCDLCDEAIDAGDATTLAIAIGAAAAARIVVPDDYAIEPADRVGGGTDDDDGAHRARKRRQVELDIIEALSA